MLVIVVIIVYSYFNLYNVMYLAVKMQWSLY